MTKSILSSACRARPLSALLTEAGVRAEVVSLTTDVKITSLADDSRDVRPGACFVAVRGVTRDGHGFVESACRAGAVAVVTDRHVAVPASVVHVRVEDARAVLGPLAASYFGLSGGSARAMTLMGITGTNGKTTVAWLLRSILQAAGKKPALLGTIEYDLLTKRFPAPLTTPGCLDLCRYLASARDAGADFGVLEVSSHALDQRRTDGLRFSAAVFTNLSGDHLDYHGTMEAYRRAKRRLFDSLDASACAVVNGDDPAAMWMIKSSAARVVRAGLESSDLEVRAVLEGADSSASRFRVKGRSFDVSMSCSLVGRHNMANVVLASATAEALGIPPESIRAGVERVTCVPGRLQRIEPDGFPFRVLVDYAHTDDALRNVLQAVRPLTRGRVLCVFGCGGDRDREKRPRMAAVVEEGADLAYVTSDNPRREEPRAIIDEIVAGFDSSERCRVVVQVDRARAIREAIFEARPGDTVLIAGKGHETYQLVGGKRIGFDDALVTRACLGEMRDAGWEASEMKRARGKAVLEDVT